MSIKAKRIHFQLAAVCVVLVLLGIALVTVVPKMSLWSRIYSNETAHYKTLTPGQSVSLEFASPCDVVSEITVDLEGVASYDDPISRIDASLAIQDMRGKVIASGIINSIYEESISVDDTRLNRGEHYTVTFNFVSSEGETGSVGIGVTDKDELSVEIRGVNSGAPVRGSFLGVYLMFSLLVLLYVYSLELNDLKKTYIADKVLFAVGVIMVLVFINQYFDLFITAKCGLRMIDAFKAGEFFSYYDHAYNAELVNGSLAKFYGYNYNVLTVLPIAVVMIPFSFFTDGGMDFGPIGDLAVWYLDILVAVLVIWSVKLTEKVSDECGMPSDYKRSVKLVYAFSPLFLYVSIGFGQIDIMYVIIMLLALPFYYRGSYKMFSFIMAFAVVMKLIPFLIFVPLLLLANKRIKDIALNTLICLSVKLVTVLIFEQGTGYSAITNFITDWHDFTGLLFANSIGGLSLFVMAFAGVCIYCYMKDVDSNNRKDLLYRSMLVIFRVYEAFAVFVDVHQQWLIPLVLSFAFLAPFFGKDRRILLLVAVVEMLLIIIHADNSDTIYMIGNGMLAIEGYNYSGIPIYEILTNITSVAFPLIRSVMAVLLISLTVIFMRRTSVSGNDGNDMAVDRMCAVGRIVLLYLYLVFCFWCYCYVG